MYSILETPMLEHEVQRVFGSTRGVFNWAVDRETMMLRRLESRGLAGIVQLHCLSDVVSMAVLLSLGWPVRPRDEIKDQAASITCDLWQAWERAVDRALSLDDREHLCTTVSDDDLHLCFHEARVVLVATIMMRHDLNPERKKCLVRYIIGLAALIRETTLSSMAMNQIGESAKTGA